MRKRNTPVGTTRNAALLSALVILTSCAQALRLKVIDAPDQHSLEGVSITWIKVQPGLLKDIDSERVEIRLPKSEGGVPIRNISSRGNHTFIFTKPGYHKATVVYHGGKGFIASPDFAKPGESGKRTSIQLTNPIVVPMLRSKGK